MLGPKLRAYEEMCIHVRVWVFSFSFHLLILVVKRKDSQKSELNHCTSQEPSGEKTRKEVSVLDVGGKTPENYSRENPRNQAGTENPIHIVPQVGFEPGS